MVVTHDVFHRVREVNAAENVATDSRMDFHLGKLSLSQFARLVKNVFGHGELANVVKQGPCEEGLHVVSAYVEEPAHLRSIDLSSTNVPMSGLVFGIDCNRQRLNGVHVNRG